MDRDIKKLFLAVKRAKLIKQCLRKASFTIGKEQTIIKSSPNNPATNRCAASVVRTFKTTMKKLKDIESMSDRL